MEDKFSQGRFPPDEPPAIEVGFIRKEICFDVSVNGEYMDWYVVDEQIYKKEK